MKAGVLVGILLFILDRWFKAWVFDHQPSRDLLPGWLRFETHWNEGIAFSLPLDGGGVLGIVLTLLVAIGVSITWFVKKKQWNAVTAATWIFLGALSNLWDRLQWGAILDYVRIWKFSILNLADILILSGVFFFIFFHSSDETLPKKG